MIEQYSFGRMVIDGREYRTDVLVFPDGRVLDNWWRASGHCLELDDLRLLLAARPRIIVAGTGASGLMRPAAGLADKLADLGILFHPHPTGAAVELHNRLAAEGRRPAACFHLTC